MKIPPVPTVPLTYTAANVKSYDGELWRILKTAGPHALRWDQLRHWGPHEGMRFEPHPAGAPQVHPEAAVLYAARDFYTAFAEVFADSHTIDRDAQSPALVSWIPTRPLRLLDLTTRSITHIFGAAAIQMIEDRSVTQAWARALYQQHDDDIDGIYSRSSVDNGYVVTLFPRSSRIPSFPAAPEEHQLLNSPAADIYVDEAAERLGYAVA